jgi:hypothetical protein
MLTPRYRAVGDVNGIANRRRKTAIAQISLARTVDVMTTHEPSTSSCEWHQFPRQSAAGLSETIDDLSPVEDSSTFVVCCSVIYSDLVHCVHTSHVNAVIVSRDGVPWALRTDVYEELYARELAGPAVSECLMDCDTFIRLLAPARVAFLAT